MGCVLGGGHNGPCMSKAEVLVAQNGIGQQSAIERDWAQGVPRRWTGDHPPPAPADPERCGCDDSRRLQDELAAVDRALGAIGQEARMAAILEAERERVGLGEAERRLVEAAVLERSLRAECRATVARSTGEYWAKRNAVDKLEYDRDMLTDELLALRAGEKAE